MDHYGICFVSGTRPAFISSIDTGFVACGFLSVEQEASDSLSVLKHFEPWKENLQVLKDKGYVFGRLVGFGGSVFSSGNTLCSFPAYFWICCLFLIRLQHLLLGSNQVLLSMFFSDVLKGANILSVPKNKE